MWHVGQDGIGDRGQGAVLSVVRDGNGTVLPHFGQLLCESRAVAGGPGMSTTGTGSSGGIGVTWGAVCPVPPSSAGGERRSERIK